MKLHEMTWPEVARLDREKTVVVAPIAACEQHSLHLPTFTDAILCGSIADAVERNLTDRILLLPTFWLGASDHHLPFGATLSLTVDTHVQVLTELLTPMLDDGFKRCAILNGHGGNVDTLQVALRRLQVQYPHCILAGASYWDLARRELAELAKAERKEMGHACEFETSMIQHFRPDLVRTEEIKNDHQTSPKELRGLYLAQDMTQRTNQGCVGYPEAASAESGKRFADAIIARVTETFAYLGDMEVKPGRQRKNL
jgi:creatinine amidohydrolase